MMSKAIRRGLLAGVFWLAAVGAALASAATPVAPCVTVTSTASGVTQEFCVPVTAANPLPVTSGGGGSSTANQGTPAVVGNAWPTYLAPGGVANAVGNPIFVNPGTGATFAVTGTFWQTTQPVSIAASAAGGATPLGNIGANNTTAVVVKGSPGTLYGVQIYGIGSAPAYLKLYNATSATCGSGTPVKRLMIPAASTAANGAGSNVTFGPQGVAFGTGITYCVTTGIADNDTTAPAASTFLINVDWN